MTKKTTANKSFTELTKHDEFVKKALQDKESAQELLEQYLPEKFKRLIDLSTIKVERESYIDSSLKKKFSDLVYSVKLKNNKQAFIYTIIEHQSQPDYWISMRLWQYSLLLLERHQHKNKKNKLPVVLPLVLYNGAEKYTAPLNFWELFDNSELAKKAMSGNYNLIDLQAMSDDDINYDKYLSFFFYVLKHINDRDTVKMLQTGMKLCKNAIIIDKRKDYLHTKLIIWYTDSKLPIEQKETIEKLIIDNLPEEDTENVMKTIADGYIEQGIEKGTARTAMKIAVNMLKKKTDINFISSVTGISLDELLTLKSNHHIAN